MPLIQPLAYLHLASLWAHVLIGTLALLLYWVPLVTAKGGRAHRRFGGWALDALLAVVVTVGALLFTRPEPFDPAWVVQFTYLSACVVTVAWLARAAPRHKAQPEALQRSWTLRIMGPILTLMAAAVLAAGLTQGDPVAAVLSWVGVFYGLMILRFTGLRAPLHPKWALGWHLTATCGLFTAVHGTLLFVAWRALVDPAASPTAAALCHGGVILPALALRLWFGRRHGVPLGFAAPLSAASAPG